DIRQKVALSSEKRMMDSFREPEEENSSGQPSPDDLDFIEPEGMVEEVKSSWSDKFSFSRIKEDMDDEGATTDLISNEVKEEKDLPVVSHKRSLLVEKLFGPVKNWRLPVADKRADFKEATRGRENEFLARCRKSLSVSFFSGKFLAIFSGATILTAAAVGYFVLPKADILITPKAEAIDQSMNVLVDKSTGKIDSSQNKIPAQLLKLDKKETRDFATTGQRQVNEKAKGVMTIYNEYSSTPQSLVEKTRFVSENGKVFRSTKTVTVPGAKINEGKIVSSSIEVEVIADQPGSEYNVEPGRFKIPGFQGTPKYDAFYGETKVIMAGGASGLMKVVSQEDIDKAKEIIWTTLQPALDQESKAQIPSNLKLLDGAFKIVQSQVSANQAVGEPAENFSLTVKGTATVMLFDENDIIELIKKKFTVKIGDDKDLIIKPGQLDYQNLVIDMNRGQMNLEVKINGQIVWRVNLNDIKQALLGFRADAVKAYLGNHPEVAEIKVGLWPFWVKSIPANPVKVIISVKE
ncbi:MAG: hypothetical protein AAB724_00415, partial [Patescibacteria group bacterium]